MSTVTICSLITLLIGPAICLSLPNYGDPGTDLPPAGSHQQEQLGHVDVTIDNSHCTLKRQVCVRKTHCLDHLLNTEDAEIISGRDRARSCTDPDHPDKHAVCCSHPGAPQPAISSHPVNSNPAGNPIPAVPDVHKVNPSMVCPRHKVCVSRAECDQYGNVGTDGAGLIDSRIKIKNCVVDKTIQEIGVCCTPPQDVKQPMPTMKPNKKFRTPNKCGIRQKTKLEISALRTLSNEAEFGEFPWQAMIFFSNYTFKCGATLIDDRWLLTAAHCVNGIRPHNLRVRLGEWKVNTFDEPLSYVDAMVASIKIHPKFNRINLHNDIAVLELTKTVPPQYHINSICLPTHGQTFWGQRCISTGWGKNAFKGQYKTTMKMIELPMVDHNTCQHQLRRTRLGRYFILDKSFLCAGGEENEDACRGDGGGPLACQDPESGNYVLTGITAWGIGCGNRNIPGVFANVQSFIPWIQTIIY